jgi:D-beta-D-heptose 7-phosphate kinase/D-beta-D-heptose 1-phosphate adenosyltransferase
VQVVDIDRESSVLGGAGNVLNNLITLGARVDACSVIGEDAIGGELLGLLDAGGIDRKMVLTQPERKTSKKSRLIASHQQVIRFDKESKEDISAASEAALLLLIEARIAGYDAVLLSDYKKGVLTPGLTQAVIALAKKAGKPVLVDPKGDDYGKYSGATLITPNKKEAAIASRIEIKDHASLLEAGETLKKSLNLDACVITLSEEGMAIFEETMTRIDATAKEVYDVTGAGDTVLATLGFAVASGMPLIEAARMANSAAAVVVGKLGSATVTIDEIIAYEGAVHHCEISEKIQSFAQIEGTIRELKNSGKKVVFTNGCFDILHRGHVEYLKLSKKEGDVLVVGLNSDASVRRLKGESRPVVCEEDRAYILAALGIVDFVVIFEEETPYELIKAVRPDILTKGADYESKTVVGSDIAGEVKLIRFVDGRSTTSTINKIKASE